MNGFDDPVRAVGITLELREYEKPPEKHIAAPPSPQTQQPEPQKPEPQVKRRIAKPPRQSPPPKSSAARPEAAAEEFPALASEALSPPEPSVAAPPTDATAGALTGPEPTPPGSQDAGASEALSLPEPSIAVPPTNVAAGASEYFRMVRLKIESCREYPYSARKRKLEGRVVVRFVIETDGRARDISVVESSGHAFLEEAAVEAVKKASPFPVPPESIFGGSVPLEIGIVFNLI
jgi:protein TonB